MFEVSAHRATAALEKLYGRCKWAIDETMQVCVHRETIDTAQMSNCSLGAQKDSACPWCASALKLPAVQSLGIHPFRWMEASRAFHLARGQ